MSDLERISETNYIPNAQDILRVRNEVEMVFSTETHPHIINLCSNSPSGENMKESATGRVMSENLFYGDCL